MVIAIFADPPVLALFVLLDEAREVVLALPGDDAEGGRSSNEEISTFAILAGLLASSYAVSSQRRRC